MSAYRTFLPDCDCEEGGILFKDNFPHCRWCRKPWGEAGMINYEDAHFKISHTPEPERIEVTVESLTLTDMGVKVLFKNAVAEKSQFPVIKAAIEQVLNSTTPAPESRDWEIVEMRSNSGDSLIGGLGTGNSKWDFFINNCSPHWFIFSVYRLSDKTTWTVGEEFKTEGRDMEYKIESFYFSSTEKKMRVSAGEIDCYFSSLQKLPPKPQSIKPPLGILPRFIHDEKRLDEINAAIRRYLTESDKPIPSEWLSEKNELETKYKQ